MRNWSNPLFDGTLEDAIDHCRHRGPFAVSLIGLDVEGTGHRAGERHTLTPQYDSIGMVPRTGNLIECSALGGGSQWRVVRVARGYASNRGRAEDLAILPSDPERSAAGHRYAPDSYRMHQSPDQCNLTTCGGCFVVE